ncbi:MAG: serine hydroxymethyltransferase [Proteobacteria bacterium]|nr:serine hydroxymethyltransferase [Pseudomonadota bacterium]
MREPSLQQTDPELARLLAAEEARQAEKIRLIASENYASRAVLEASGSVLANKYSEGYPGRRYYEGQQQIDAIEQLAIDRAQALFGAEAVNVQPYSGTPANLAVYLAFCKPGDTVLGMGLPHGGHLTHGWSVSITGRYFNAIHYGVRREDGRVDLDQVRELARQHRPRLLWAGFSSYSRVLDWAAFAAIAQEVDAIFVADMAHVSGLVAGGAYPSPVPHADVVTTTTHKTLRGPRGGMILCRAAHRKVINAAVFPGVQGGPHNQTTGALAVALKEAAGPAFRAYAEQTVANARALAEALLAKGYSVISGGTDNHLLVVDVTHNRPLSGKGAARALDAAGIVCSANTIPFDPRKPFDPSGIRLGTPAVASRGMREPEMRQIADWIDRVLNDPADEGLQHGVAAEVAALCAKFPAPGLSAG